MYIEFALPRANGILAVGRARTEIGYDLEQWANTHEITVKECTFNNWCIQVYLSTEQDYVDFLVSFNPMYTSSQHYEFIKD